MTESRWDDYVSAEGPTAEEVQTLSSDLASDSTALGDAAYEVGTNTDTGWETSEASSAASDASWYAQGASQDVADARQSMDAADADNQQAVALREDAANQAAAGWDSVAAVDINEADALDSSAASQDAITDNEVSAASGYMSDATRAADSAAGNASDSSAATDASSSADTTWSADSSSDSSWASDASADSSLAADPVDTSSYDAPADASATDTLYDDDLS